MSDVDFLKRTVNLRRQLDGRAKHLCLVDATTPSSVRSVPVSAPLLVLLAEHVRLYGPDPDAVLCHQGDRYLSDNRFNWQ